MHRKWPLELITWSAAIAVLSLSYPVSHTHFTLCPIYNLGFTLCPGCGLGRSISYLLHGEVALSLKQHWLGIPAFCILAYRILQLLVKFVLNLTATNQLNHGKRSAF